MKKIIFLSLLCMTAVQMYSQTMKATIIMRDSIVYTGELVNMNSKGVTCIIDGSQTSFVAEELGDVYLENGQVKHYNPILGKRNKPKETSETTKRLLPAPIIATIIMRDSAVIVGELVQMSDIDVDCIIDGAKTKFSAEELSEVRLDNGSVKHYNDIIRKQEEPIVNIAEQTDSNNSNAAYQEDKVIKTDGTSLTGEVITITENEVQFRKNSTSAVYVINKDNIHSIEFKEGYVETYNKLKGSREASKSILKKGYHGYASFAGGGFVSSDLGWACLGGGLISLQTIHGYQFNPYVYLGGGTGFDFAFPFNNWGEIGVCMPLFADLRLSLPVRNAAPFFDLKLGGYAQLNKVYYSDYYWYVSLGPSPADWGQKSPVNYGGFYFSPSLGSLFSITEKYSIGFALEYFFTIGNKGSNKEIWNFLDVRIIFGF